jgi:methyl-accepting chemotaxis protein
METFVNLIAEPIKLLLAVIYAWFREANVAIFVSAALLFAALLVYAYFRAFRISPYFKALRRASSTVSKFPDRQIFCSGFSNVDEELRQEPLLAHAWTAFEETLVKPEADELQIIGSTERPSAYLNIQSAVESGLPLGFYQAVPNYFVGVGLLFTFFGLVAALHFASEGLAHDASVKDAQTALRSLLEVASFKFLTSISGILSSLILSVLIRRDVHRLQIAFDSLCQLLEKRLTTLSPESIATQQLRESRKQSDQLLRFNTDFAVQLAEAIESKLNDRLGATITAALDPLAKRLEGISTSVGSASEDALKKMLEDFTGRLHQSAGTEMQALAEELKRIQGTLEKASGGVDASAVQFGARMESAAERLERMLADSATATRDGLGEAMSRMQTLLAETSETLRRNAEAAGASTHEAVNRAGGALATQVTDAASKLESSLTPALGALSGLEQLLNRLTGRMESQTDQFTNSVECMRQLVREVGTTSDRVKEAALPVAKTAEQLGKAAEQTDRASGVTARAFEQISALASELSSHVSASKQIWEEYRSRFERVDTALAASVAELIAGLERYQEGVGDFVLKMDQHMGDSLNSLASGTERLADSVESLDTTLSKTGGRFPA